MRKYFTHQLEELKHNLIFLGANVERQIEQSTYALETQDLEIAQKFMILKKLFMKCQKKLKILV